MKAETTKKAQGVVPIGRISDLTPEQELFCQLYATNREFFGNGTQAYIEAYNIDTTQRNAYKSAMSMASRLLRNVKILARLHELMEIGVLNDARVDKELAFLIEQNSEFGVKLGAIREYNALKARIKQKLDLTTGDQPITGIKVEIIKNKEEIKDDTSTSGENPESPSN